MDPQQPKRDPWAGIDTGLSPTPAAPKPDPWAGIDTGLADVPAGDLGATFTVNGKPAPKGWLDQTADFVASTLKQVNPVAGLSAAGNAVLHPIDTAKSLGAAQGDQEKLAEESFKAGNYVEGMRHALAYLIPIVGPSLLGDAGDQMKAGNYGKGMGIGAGQGLAMVAPALIPKKIGIPAMTKGANPAEAEAVQFGLDRGIPVDAATATGNPVIRGTQFLADRSLAGGLTVAPKAARAQAAGLTRVGEDLAAQSNRASGGGVMTKELAGDAVRTAVEAKVNALHETANSAYETLRTIEADPKNAKTVQTGTREIITSGGKDAAGNLIEITDPQYQHLGTKATIPVTESMAMPVDLRSVKTSLRPIYDRWMRQASVTQQEGSQGLKALGNIVNGKDFESASIVDTDLSAIKRIGRGADMPALRDTSQGLAAVTIKRLDSAVRQAVAKAGPEAVKALQDGRAATIEKHGVADVLDTLKAEPVKTIRAVTAGGDAGLEQLRSIQKVAPETLPHIGRAVLDDLMGTATSEGGFAHAQKLFADWNRLGPETKKLIFADSPGLVPELDQFFLLAKKMAENPNPSGTAYVASLATQASVPATLLLTNPAAAAGAAALQIPAYALSRLMHSTRFVKALTRGMTIPVSAKGAATSAAGQILKAAEDAGVPVMNPVAGQAPANQK